MPADLQKVTAAAAAWKEHVQKWVKSEVTNGNQLHPPFQGCFQILLKDNVIFFAAWIQRICTFFLQRVNFFGSVRFCSFHFVLCSPATFAPTIKYKFASMPMRLIHTLRLNGALDLLFCAWTTCEKEIFVFRWRSKQGVGSICLYFLSVWTGPSRVWGRFVSTSLQCEQVQAVCGSICLYFPSVWTGPSSVRAQCVCTSFQCEQVQAGYGVNLSLLLPSVNRS